MPHMPESASVLDTTPPSYAECQSALERIKGTAEYWKLEHPEYRLVVASGMLDPFDVSRLAAYRLKGQKPPLGYYDDLLDKLLYAVALLRQERYDDHGDAQDSLVSYRDPNHPDLSRGAARRKVKDGP